MDVRNCKKCKRLFNYIAGPIICPACKEELEKKFDDVKKYIREHPTANIPEICSECDVDTNQIHQWIREERLIFASNSPVGIPCERCGTLIKSGKYCDKCKNELANSLGQSIAKPVGTPKEIKKPTTGNPAMRFLK